MPLDGVLTAAMIWPFTSRAENSIARVGEVRVIRTSSPSLLNWFVTL